MTPRPPFPPFTEETARQKVQAAEDGWNTRDPERVALAYTEDSVWRNRDEFVSGRADIIEFLRRKWDRERDYTLRKELELPRQPHRPPARAYLTVRRDPGCSSTRSCWGYLTKLD